MTFIHTLDAGFSNLDDARTYLREQLENGVEIIACSFSAGGRYHPPSDITPVLPPRIIVLSNGIIVDFVIAGPWEMNRDFWKREWPKQGFYLALNDAARELDVRFTPSEDGYYYYNGNDFIRYELDNDADILTIKMINPPLYRAVSIPSDNQGA